MTFLVIKPEASGHPGEDTVITSPGPPPIARDLHYEFDWWVGDDLVGSFPFFLTTERLKAALTALGSPSGFSFAPVKVTTSPFFRKTNPGRTLPPFWWLKVAGKAGLDDMGLSGQRALVVSGRVLTVLLAHTLDQAEISQYRSAGS